MRVDAELGGFNSFSLGDEDDKLGCAVGESGGFYSERFNFFALATTHILLCATHRTGSNLLEQYLKAAGVAGRPREYYSPSLARELAVKMGLADPDKEFMRYHSGIVEKWTTPNGVFAAKVMWRHLRAIHERVAADPQGGAYLGAEPWDTVERLHPNTRVVWVSRKDKVKQAISMVRAKQTGVYSTVHVDYGRLEQKGPGEYDFHVLQYHVEKLTAEDAEWGRLFAERGVRVQQVVFEEFIKAPQQGAMDLLKALELPEPEVWQWPAIQIRPQADETSAAWYARYHEDVLHLAEKKDEHREKRHRARKALEKQAARQARWDKWEGSGWGRRLVALERWWRRGEGAVDSREARGDGVVRH